MKESNSKNSVLMMAVAKGKKSTDGPSFKRYTGIGSCFIKCVNPNKDELEKAFNISLDEDPSYIGEQVVEEKGIKVTYPTARISFLVNPDPEKYGFDTLISVPLFLRKQYRFNKDETSVQVIDKYGQTAWATMDEVKNKRIPMYSNGPANIDIDYRPAYVGEEELTKFLIAYLGIPGPRKYNRAEKKWYMVDNPQDSECRIDNIEKLFDGDFSEIREYISYQPDNKVKILFGVRTSDDNKLYQTVYSKMFLKNNNNDYEKLESEVKASKDAGAYANTEFVIGELREYIVEETKFNNADAAGSPLPFATPSDNPWA